MHRRNRRIRHIITSLIVVSSVVVTYVTSALLSLPTDEIFKIKSSGYLIFLIGLIFVFLLAILQEYRTPFSKLESQLEKLQIISVQEMLRNFSERELKGTLKNARVCTYVQLRGTLIIGEHAPIRSLRPKMHAYATFPLLSADNQVDYFKNEGLPGKVMKTKLELIFIGEGTDRQRAYEDLGLQPKQVMAMKDVKSGFCVPLFYPNSEHLIGALVILCTRSNGDTNPFQDEFVRKSIINYSKLIADVLDT